MGTETARCTVCQCQPKWAGRKKNQQADSAKIKRPEWQEARMVSKGAVLFLITCSSVILSLALCDCMWVVSILHPSFPVMWLESQIMWSDLFLNRVGTDSNTSVRHPYQAGLESPTSPNDRSIKLSVESIRAWRLFTSLENEADVSVNRRQ